MLGKRTLMLLLILIVAAFSAISYISILGQANSQDRSGAAGQIALTNSSQVSIRYHINEEDPAHIGTVFLEILQPGGGFAPRQVVISLDGGATWIECSPSQLSEWICDFSQRDYHVLSIDAVEIVLN